ncbi:MAG: hypothetical protein KAT70_04505, partial [Thermoplasmata archaeon]|nr:hypothetical protein [Thermoplasmata archaeon]
PPAPPMPPGVPQAPPPQAAWSPEAQAMLDSGALVQDPQDSMSLASPGGSFTLCVNTHPMKAGGADVVLFSEVFREVQKRMTTDTNLPDYRMEEYGKGPGRMVAYLEGILGELELGFHTILVVDSRTVEGSHALPTLERLAGTIFRGF